MVAPMPIVDPKPMVDPLPMVDTLPMVNLYQWPKLTVTYRTQYTHCFIPIGHLPLV